jgi:hypothetical protein
MEKVTQEFRTPRWLRLVLGGATVGATAGIAVWVYLNGTERAWLGVAGLLALIVATLDSATTRVTLGRSAIVIVSNFRRRDLPRHEIDSVTWEAGVGVSLKLKGGAWVKLPDVGNSQSRANSIRAWIRRGAT